MSRTISPYEVVMEALSKFSQEGKRKGILTFQEADMLLRRTPGLCFEQRITVEEIIKTLERWRFVETLPKKMIKVLTPAEHRAADELADKKARDSFCNCPNCGNQHLRPQK